MVLLSILAFVCPPTRSHDENVDFHTCIMWSHEQKWDRTPWLLEYWNIFSFDLFVRFDFYRTKAPKDKNQSGQNTQKRKYFNTITIKVYDQIFSEHVITWYRCGQSTFSSCDHVGGQRKAKMDKSTIGQKEQRIKIKADKTTKRENILILQQSRCTIPFLFMWSHDTGVDNQHSRHAITWVDREKPKWTKAP